MVCSGSEVCDPVGKAAPSHGKSEGWTPSRGTAAEQEQPERGRVTPQRFCISVYLCCSEMVPCH